MPISAAPAPPAVRQPRATKAKAGVPEKTKVEERTEGLAGLSQIASAILLMTKQYADAGAVNHFAPAICRETAKLAEDNEKLGAGIDYLTAIGPYTALFAAVLPFGLQIAANHKRLNPELLAGSGVIHPDVLEAQVKADIMRQRAQAMEAQRRAEEEYSRLMEPNDEDAS